MDEFWTAEETAFRSRAAAFFGGLPAPGAARPLEEIWAEVARQAPGDDTDGFPAGSKLSGRVSVLDEAARRDPELARGLLTWLESAAPLDPSQRAACELGRLAGTASHVFAAATAAARERGYFSSILMDFRAVQEKLARLMAESELARFGACRLCRLLERGDTISAGRETAGLEARAAALAGEIRSVAAELLGPSWAAARLPEATGHPPMKGSADEA